MTEEDQLLFNSKDTKCRVGGKEKVILLVIASQKVVIFAFQRLNFLAFNFFFFPHNFSPLKAYVGSEVMYDETAVASSPPPYTAYAAPTPEVGSRSSLYRIQLRETWGLCATILLTKRKL